MSIDIKIVPKGLNIPGYYRKCEDEKCALLVPCPHVRCQEHRTDFAVDEWVVTGIDPSTLQENG